MTMAWAIYLLVIGTLLTLAASAAAAALAAAGRPTRWAWAAALAAITLLAIVAPRAHRLDLRSTVSEASPSVERPSANEPARWAAAAALEEARGAISSVVAGAVSLVSARVPAAITRPVMIGWAATSMLLLSLYLFVNLRLARARRGWPLERVQGLRVRVAPAAGPAVIGLLRAEIVVPRSLLERSGDEQRLIVAHEHEHLAARDHLLLTAACLVVIAMPWHPAAWYLLGRLRLAIELDCDRRVLRRGAGARSYGALLIDMAAHGVGIRVGTIALADRPSHLERRLLAMRSPRSRHPFMRGSALCTVAALLVLVACEAKIPTAAEMTSMDMAGIEKAAVKSELVGKIENADYFIDGLPATRDAVHSLAAKDIGSVEVVKGGRDTIIVTTAARMVPGDTQPSTFRRVPGTDEFMLPLWNGEKARAAIMIDGKIASAEAFVALKQSDITSVNVMKPRTDLGGPPYPNGLISVSTKRRMPMPAGTPDPNRSLERTRSTGEMLPKIRDARAEPVVSIDGVPSTMAALQALPPTDIYSMDVLTGAQALAASSDPAARNGFVRVVTRAAQRK